MAGDCRTGPRDIITAGEDGLLFEPGSPESLTAALDRLLADPELRRQMGARAAQISGRYRTDQVAAMWEAVIDETRRMRA